MYLTIIIPAYNESSNVESVIEELIKIVGEIDDVKRLEIIVVDDHSNDGTFDVVKNIAIDEVKAIRLSRRNGSHVALRTGIMNAEGDIVLCIASDGQDNPAVIRDMINKVKSGVDIVWAVRENRDEAFLSAWLARGFYAILGKITDSELNARHLTNADFFMIDKKVIGAINQCKERNTSLFGLLLWMGFKQDFVVYKRRDRRHGESKWNFTSKLKVAQDWIIAFSGIPLRLITIFGFCFAGLGFCYAVFIVFYSILGYAAPGWAETVILLMVTGGLQMIMLGVIGEYLWRTLEETRKRPLFFIENSHRIEK